MQIDFVSMSAAICAFTDVMGLAEKARTMLGNGCSPHRFMVRTILKQKGGKPYHDAKPIIVAEMLRTQSPEVDTFTGATGSSNQWMQAVALAMENARI